MVVLRRMLFFLSAVVVVALLTAAAALFVAISAMKGKHYYAYLRSRQVLSVSQNIHKKRSANGVNIYGLLAKLLRSGWLDIGQVPFFFFLRVYGPFRSSAILTERGWSIKDLLYGQRTLFFAGHSR